MTEIQGFCRDDFAPVKAQFAEHFAQGLERGASVAVTLHGEPVVDLWAGDADDHGTPWDRDSITNVWSTTKTMAAICMLMLADRGELDLNAPIARYWPEFKANGKDQVTTAQVLGHTSGVPGWDPAIAVTDLYDWEKATSVLAAGPLWWEPGTMSGYHALCQGHLEGEILRRITGRSIGTFFREEVAEPLGADFHIGLPENEDHRYAPIVPPDAGIADVEGLDFDSLPMRILLSCPATGAEPNTRDWRAAEIPAAGGIGNARAVGRVHSAIACGGEVDGVRLLSPEGVEQIFVEQHNGPEAVLGIEMRLGTGFGLTNEMIPLSPNERACFWGGWGGSIAVIDVDAEMTVSYVMNRMAGSLVGDLRGATLVMAAYQSLSDAGV
ncbi:MAG: beta-lactamase family protein [Acidimicrobiales bacterium]|nr:beta-lactamase family protein [Acidimicrobiales bacterium]